MRGYILTYCRFYKENICQLWGFNREDLNFCVRSTTQLGCTHKHTRARAYAKTNMLITKYDVTHKQTIATVQEVSK